MVPIVLKGFSKVPLKRHKPGHHLLHCCQPSYLPSLHSSPLSSDRSVTVLPTLLNSFPGLPTMVTAFTSHTPGVVSVLTSFLSVWYTTRQGHPGSKESVSVYTHSILKGSQDRNSRKELEARTKIEARQEQCSQASSTCFHILSRNTTCPGVASPH